MCTCECKTEKTEDPRRFLSFFYPFTKNETIFPTFGFERDFSEIGLKFVDTVKYSQYFPERHKIAILIVAIFLSENLPYGTNVCFDGFLWSSPSTCLPICLRPGGRGGRKQIGRQVEGFSLFGCAAAGGRGIRYK